MDHLSPSHPNAKASPDIARTLTTIGVVGSVVLVFALLGILTRPIGFLAALWPANAVLLGLLVRRPDMASPAGWLAACGAYLIADFATGSDVLSALWLNTTNMTGVATGFLLFEKYRHAIQNMRRPFSVLRAFGICVAASAAAAIVGSGAAPLILERSIFTGLILWFTTELLNYVLFLPLFLTFRPMRAAPIGERKSDTGPVLFARQRKRPFPLLALAGTLLLGIVVGGPGALAFPVPALLWCALTYSLFSTAVLTMLTGVITLMSISAGWISLPFTDDFMHSIISVRLGILLITLGPLTVGSVNAAHGDLVRQLDHAVSYDSLTQALSRRVFLSRADALLQTLAAQDKTVAVMMLDIDHFKSINDTHGHPTGDRILFELATEVQQCLRQQDLFGRLGGEEFAIILPELDRETTLMIAQRLRERIEKTTFLSPEHRPLRVSVSIGMCHSRASDAPALQPLLTAADEALYRAKHAGRNRVESA